MSIPVGHRIWLVDTVVQRAVGGHFPHSGGQDDTSNPIDHFLGQCQVQMSHIHLLDHPLPSILQMAVTGICNNESCGSGPFRRASGRWTLVANVHKRGKRGNVQL